MKPLFIAALISIIAAACGGKKPAGDIRLASFENWPDSLVISTHYSGGMINEYTSVMISKDSCVVIDKQDNLENHFRVFATKEQLNELLLNLVDQHIDYLESKKLNTVIFDAPTFGMNIDLGSKSKNLANGATEEVVGKNEQDFNRCYGLIAAFSRQMLAGQEKKFCINIDESVRNSSGILSVIPRRGADSWTDSAKLVKPSYCYPLLPGSYYWQIHLTGTGKPEKIIKRASLYPVIKIGSNDTAVTLHLKNDSTLVLQ